MDNIKVMFEGNNLLIFLIVLIAMMGLFVLVGNVIKTFREIKKPKDESREDLKAQFTGLKMSSNFIRVKSTTSGIRTGSNVKLFGLY